MAHWLLDINFRTTEAFGVRQTYPLNGRDVQARRQRLTRRLLVVRHFFCLLRLLYDDLGHLNRLLAGPISLLSLEISQYSKSFIANPLVKTTDRNDEQ